MLHEESLDNKKGRIALLLKKNIKFRLKGHESFYIREGWLRKGMKSIENNEFFFTESNAADNLGVGSNMVKSIKYWLHVTGLADESIAEKGKRKQTVTIDFGQVINDYDPCFEDIFTLWLIHYKIASNKELATSWYLFFNNLNAQEFSKDDLRIAMLNTTKLYLKDQSFSENTLNDDVNCVLKTYFTDKKEDKNPEDTIICPLTELGLLKKLNVNGNEVYLKTKPSTDKLHKLIVLYIIRENMNKQKSTTIEKILSDTCNAGKILNLDRNLLNYYLDELKNDNYIQIIRTAGLDTIYLKKDCDCKDILLEYYTL